MGPTKSLTTLAGDLSFAMSGEVETCLQILYIRESILYKWPHFRKRLVMLESPFSDFPFPIADGSFLFHNRLQFFGWKRIFLSTDKVFSDSMVFHTFPTKCFLDLHLW